MNSIELCTIASQAAGSEAVDKHHGRDAGPAITSSAEPARLGLTGSKLHTNVPKVRLGPKATPMDKALGNHEQHASTAATTSTKRLSTIEDLSRACRASTTHLLELSNDDLYHMMREAEADGHLIGMLGRQRILHDATVLRDNIETRARMVFADIAAVKVQAVWRGRMVRRAQIANSRVATLPGLVDDT